MSRIKNIESVLHHLRLLPSPPIVHDDRDCSESRKPFDAAHYTKRKRGCQTLLPLTIPKCIESSHAYDAVNVIVNIKGIGQDTHEHNNSYSVYSLKKVVLKQPVPDEADGDQTKCKREKHILMEWIYQLMVKGDIKGDL